MLSTPYARCGTESWNLIAASPYPDGTPKEEGFANPNNPNEFFVREYYSNGQLMKEYYVEKGKANGPAKAYYRSGPLNGEANFIDGKWDGLARRYAEDGKVIAEGNFRKGDGVEKRFYPDGTIRAEVSYENQKRHGISREYYRNGNLKYEDTFRKDFRSERKKYTKAGSLAFHEKYEAHAVGRAFSYLLDNLNENIGPEVRKRYYRDGSLKQEASYIIGKRHGISRVYHSNGVIKYEDTYRRDKFLRRKVYDREGKWVREIDLRRNWIKNASAIMKDKKVLSGQAGGGGGGGSKNIPFVNYDSSS